MALWTNVCLDLSAPFKLFSNKKHKFRAQCAPNLQMLQIVVTAIRSGIKREKHIWKRSLRGRLIPETLRCFGDMELRGGIVSPNDTHERLMDPRDGFPSIFWTKAEIALKLGSSVRIDAWKGNFVFLTRTQSFSVLYRLLEVPAQRPPESGTGSLKWKITRWYAPE